MIDTTMRILRAHGISGFSIQNVAREAGVSRGALRYHFPNEESLLISARLRIVELMLVEIPSPISCRTIDEKVDEVVERYWRVFGSEDYIVAIEIRLYERFSAPLADAVRARLEEATEVFNREWVRVFSESMLETERLIGLRIFMLDVLRGLALRRIEGWPVGAFSRELSLLKQVLASSLGN